MRDILTPLGDDDEVHAVEEDMDRVILSKSLCTPIDGTCNALVNDRARTAAARYIDILNIL